MKNLSVVLVGVFLGLFVLLAGFLIGRRFYFGDGFHYGFSKPFFEISGGYAKDFPRRGRGLGVYAEVVKKEGDKLSLKFPNGITNDLELSDNTLVYTQNKGSLNDIREGDRIIIKKMGGLDQVIVVEKQ